MHFGEQNTHKKSTHKKCRFTLDRRRCHHRQPLRRFQHLRRHLRRRRKTNRRCSSPCDGRSRHRRSDERPKAAACRAIPHSVSTTITSGGGSQATARSVAAVGYAPSGATTNADTLLAAPPGQLGVLPKMPISRGIDQPSPPPPLRPDGPRLGVLQGRGQGTSDAPGPSRSRRRAPAGGRRSRRVPAASARRTRTAAHRRSSFYPWALASWSPRTTVAPPAADENGVLPLSADGGCA